MPSSRAGSAGASRAISEPSDGRSCHPAALLFRPPPSDDSVPERRGVDSTSGLLEPIGEYVAKSRLAEEHMTEASQCHTYQPIPDRATRLLPRPYAWPVICR